jgi:hypothetical protein
MVSFEVRRTRRVAIVLTLVACVPRIASSQPGPITEEQRRIIAERIEEARAQGGPYSKELIDPLTSLAELYSESGNHDLAMAVSEQAMQVIRANYGLRSLDQAPLMRERIRSEEERGNAALAWELEQALLTLARANPDDQRSAAIFSEIGDKRMNLLRRYDAGEFPPQVQLGCYYGAAMYERLAPVPGTCASGSRRVAGRAMLADAQRNYVAAIRVLARDGQFSSAELQDLELDLIRSTYQYTGNYYGGNYQTGRRSLRRLVAYDVANAEPLVGRADALLQIADWDLLYGQRPLALDTYEATYEFLKREGVEPAAIYALFSPEVPVVLPAFLPNPLATSPSDEHIDVSFEITRFGTTGRVKVLAKTTNASDEAEERLVRLIERRQFRPRVVDGEFPRSTPVVVRYHLND